MKTVVIADDHTLIAKALTGIIEKFGEFKVLYEVENGKQLITSFNMPKNIPDIVLLDVNMPEMNGYETARWLRDNHPEVRVLALSVQDEESTLLKMVQCGARGYLLKNVRPAELNTALNSVLEKGYYYPEWVTHKVMIGLAKSEIPDQPTLNDREMEFLHYAASELTYREIADKMCCSPRTVESYRDSLFQKFGLKTRVGLVIYALKNQIISLEA